jgi:hypothetical protein
LSARRKKNRRGAARAAAPNSAVTESRGVEALTVFWMLSALATLIAETAATAALLATSLSTDGEGSFLSRIPGLMLFTALVTGAICLVLTPLVLRLREFPPPRGIVAAAVLIGASPWLLVLAFLFWG